MFTIYSICFSLGCTRVEWCVFHWLTRVFLPLMSSTSSNYIPRPHHSSLHFQVPYYVMDVVSLKKLEAIKLSSYWPTSSERTRFLYLSALAQILVFVSSCCNPVIYGILNENYREYKNVAFNVINAGTPGIRMLKNTPKKM